jgi:hypothetical protein
MATIKLNRIINSRPTQNHLHKRQLYTARKLRNKLVENNLIIVPADKGRTTVVIEQNTLKNKVNAFLSDNNFTTLRQNPTTTYVKQIVRALKDCPDIIDKHKIKHLTPIHPVPPTLTVINHSLRSIT